MFTKIGKTIKGLAKIIFYTIEAAAICAGVILARQFPNPNIGALYFFAVLIAGSIAAVLSSILLYGFGELVDNSQKSVEQLQLIEQKIK